VVVKRNIIQKGFSVQRLSWVLSLGGVISGFDCSIVVLLYVKELLHL